MPYESQVKTWKKYDPSQKELDKVASLQAEGAPRTVYYVDTDEMTSVQGDYQHEMYFFKNETTEYHGNSDVIVNAPNENILAEMKQAGVVT